MRNKKTFLITIPIAVFVFALIQHKIAGSQIAPPEIPTSLRLKTDTPVPSPNSSVIVRALLSGDEAAGANFSWFLDGVKQTESSGIDKSSFSFNAKALGDVYKITIVAALTSGRTLSDSLSFTVSDIDLTWSAMTLAPPDYEGKKLPSSGSIVRLSALPFLFMPGARTYFNPDNLIYNWSINNIPDQTNSGMKKSNYNFVANSKTGEIVKLEIKNAQNTIAMTKNIVIPVVSPLALPFLADENGIISYKNAVTSANLERNQKIILKAVTYFFSKSSEKLNWQWSVNDEIAKNISSKPWLANLTIPESIAAPAAIKIGILVSEPDLKQQSAQSFIDVKIIQ